MRRHAHVDFQLFSQKSSGIPGKKFVGHYAQSILPFFFFFLGTCLAFRHHWLLPFYITFTDLDLALGSLVQCEAKPIDLIFSHTFHLVRMNFDVASIQTLLLRTFTETFGINAVLPAVDKD